MIRLPTRLTTIMGAAVLLAGFHGTPVLAREPVAPASPPAKTAEVQATPALWKVTDKDTTIYLFGTVHALPAGIDWYHGAVRKALEASGTLVTEIPSGAAEAPATRQLFLKKAMLPEGESLRGMLDSDQRKTYEAALAKLGLPAAAFDRFKPWFASVTLTMLPLVKAGFDPENGVDKAIDAKAGAKMQRDAFETVDYQLSLFDSMPQAMQVKFLMATLSELDRAGETMHAMVAEWAKGDAEQLASLMNKEIGDSAIAERLLYQRNRHWAKWIENRLKTPGTIFVAVGAGHLAGEHSVQDYLAADGVKTTRVQ